MNVLIVEDEILVACELEATLEDLGCCVIGIAPDRATALSLASGHLDLAFVDNNLRDGETGPRVGEALVAMGVRVVFVTGNPRALGDGVPGAVGVYTKPLDTAGLSAVVVYVAGLISGRPSPPPAGLLTFDRLDG